MSVALVIQHPLRLRRIILPPVAYYTFPHFPINGTIFGGKNRIIGQKMCDMFCISLQLFV